MSEILLSIGMIVKNESRSLEQCLKALEQLRSAIPCELVIADTGSSDGTQEIAAKYADIFFEYPWINDFAAARNAVMERSSGKWYLSIDADEYLDPNIGELVAFLRENTNDCKLAGAFLQIYNYSTADCDPNNARPFLAPRLIYMASGIRFQGKIHEAPLLPWGEETPKLQHTILWHDGYIYASQTEWRKKSRRNCTLIEQELKKKPNDPMLHVQLIESCKDNSVKMGYIKRSLCLKEKQNSAWVLVGPVIYAHATGTACALFPQEKPEKWAILSIKEFPDSPYTQIDVNFIMTQYYYKCKDWSKVIQTSEAYFKANQLWEENRYDFISCAGSIILYATKMAKTLVTVWYCEASINLGNPMDAEAALKAIDVKTLPASCAEGYVYIILKLEKSTDVSELIEDISRLILHSEPQDSLEWDRKTSFQRTFEKAFQDGWNSDNDEERPAYRLISLLGDSVYSPCANIMLEEQEKVINHNLELITDWKRVPPAVFVRLMELEIAIPEAFFVQATLDRITSIVKSLPSLMDDFEEKSYQYAVGSPQNATIGQLTWNVNLILEVCMIHDWRKRDEFGITLYQSCCHIMKQFFKAYYCAQMLENADYARVLPEAQMAGWYLVQAEQARSNDDLRSFARILKEMVHKLPAWKKMIGFLGEYYAPASEPLELDKDALQEKDDAVSKELLALAQQIKTILAQFPANHPSVKALKMSDAYQKVAKLIEEMD